MELTQILLAPVVSEKSTGHQTQRVYTFHVHPAANKIEIQKAVEEAYGVKVRKVAVIPVHKKFRLAGKSRVITKRPAGKKALVTLEPKQILDFNKFAKK